MASATVTPQSRFRRISAALFRHPGGKLAILLAPPLGWMAIVYLTSLALLLLTSFWRLNELTSQIERVAILTWGSSNKAGSAIHQGTRPSAPHARNAAIAVS